MKRKIWDSIMVVICGITGVFGVFYQGLILIILSVGLLNALLLSMIHLEIRKKGKGG